MTNQDLVVSQAATIGVLLGVALMIGGLVVSEDSKVDPTTFP
jgi:hypothetical protein